MIKRQRIISISLAMVLLYGCMSTRPSFTNVLKEENANFILYISNQSFKEPLVNIQVVIDGRTIVKDDFKVKNQHYWKIYALKLTPGDHTLQAKAERDITEINRSFKVAGNHWAVLNFWGNGKNTDTSKLRGLTFDIYDKPIGFL